MDFVVEGFIRVMESFKLKIDACRYNNAWVLNIDADSLNNRLCSKLLDAEYDEGIEYEELAPNKKNKTMVKKYKTLKIKCCILKFEEEQCYLRIALNNDTYARILNKIEFEVRDFYEKNNLIKITNPKNYLG